MFPAAIFVCIRLRIDAMSQLVAWATRDATADGTASGLASFRLTLHSIISPSKLPTAKVSRVSAFLNNSQCRAPFRINAAYALSMLMQCNFTVAGMPALQNTHFLVIFPCGHALHRTHSLINCACGQTLAGEHNIHSSRRRL